jgi:hypothetical protein
MKRTQPETATHVSLRDRRAFKKTFTILMTQLKLRDVEVSSYRILIEQLKENGPDIPWEKMLKKIRSTKQFRQHFRKKYDVTLENFLAQIDAEVSRQEERLFLREWKPKGRAN